MLSTIKEHLDRDDEGFTLIELMVVVLIIAILLAIAIPTFLGARNSANARAAQSNLRNALTAEQTVYTNGQAFSTDVTSGGVLLSAEPNLGWTTTAPSSSTTANNAVFVATADANSTLWLMAYGKDKNCYIIQQVNGTQASIATSYAVVPGACPSTMPSGAVNQFGTGSAPVGTAGTFPTTFYPSW